jgi:hypothetical protein
MIQLYAEGRHLKIIIKVCMLVFVSGMLSVPYIYAINPAQSSGENSFNDSNYSAAAQQGYHFAITLEPGFVGNA